MGTYRGIPFNGGMDAPSGSGSQHIVQTCVALTDLVQDVFEFFILRDAGGQPSIDYSNRFLRNAAGSQTADWQNYRLIDDVNSVISLDWINRQTNNIANAPTMDWGLGHLISPVIGIVLDWSTGIGFFNAPSTTQYPAGPATADVTYGATEQLMLQTVYDALRTFGLMS